MNPATPQEYFEAMNQWLMENSGPDDISVGQCMTLVDRYQTLHPHPDLRDAAFIGDMTQLILQKQARLNREIIELHDPTKYDVRAIRELTRKINAFETMKSSVTELFFKDARMKRPAPRPK